MLAQALSSLPPRYRPGADNPDAPQILIRSDSAGATYGLSAVCRTAGVGFSLGAAIDAPIREAVEVLNTSDGWYPAIQSDGGIRDGAWVGPAASTTPAARSPDASRSRSAAHIHDARTARCV